MNASTPSELPPDTAAEPVSAALGGDVGAASGSFVHGSGNVFTDLGFAPEEAANLQLRSRLAIAIERYVEAEGLTQTEAAERLGVTQPRVSDLARGKLDRFTVDALVNMLARVGRYVEVRIHPSGSSGGPDSGGEPEPLRQAA